MSRKVTIETDGEITITANCSAGDPGQRYGDFPTPPEPPVAEDMEVMVEIFGFEIPIKVDNEKFWRCIEERCLERAEDDEESERYAAAEAKAEAKLERRMETES